MKYVAKILITKVESVKMEEILSIKEGHYEEHDRDGVIQTYSATFANGFFVDVKVCNGNTPYVDSVLFDENGCEVDVLDVSETLLGEYTFGFEGDVFEVSVEVESEDAKWNQMLEKLNEMDSIQANVMPIVTLLGDCKVLVSNLWAKHSENEDAFITPFTVVTEVSKVVKDFYSDYDVKTIVYDVEKVEHIFYEKPLDAVSMFSGEPVQVIGERTVTDEGRVLEQYLYHIVGYQAKNGQPFLSLKANIVLSGKN